MPTAKRAITSRVTIQNPRPRKYASAAERQKALRERFPTLCVRVEQEQADFMKRIAEEQGRTLQDVHLAFIKYANGRGNQWLTQGLKGFAPLPRFEEPPKENPMKRKPTPAQLAARERFAEMARSGAFKRKASKARKNPAPLKMKIRGSETPDNPEGIIVTEAGALRFAKANMPADLKRAGFVPSVVAGARGWSINYGKAVPGHSSYKRNPRASNPIILVSDKAIASKRKANPVKRKVTKEKRPFYYIVKVGQSYDGQFLSSHYSLEDVKKIAQQKADKYGAQAKITEFHS